ncbi:cytochrome P450 [Streptomyces sp. NPDC004561]
MTALAGEAPVGRCPFARLTAATDADLVDPTLYGGGDAPAVWRELRARDRLHWQQVDAERGFWSAFHYADADLVLRDATTFTSERGTLLDLLGTDDPAGGQQLAVTDPPVHTARQARLKRALTSKAVGRQRERIRALLVELLEPLGDGGVFDFATAMMAMPMWVTGTMMDLPRADWEWLTRATTQCIAADDPEFQEPGGKAATLNRAHMELFGYFQDVVRHRQRHPGDDLLSSLLSTRFEGRTMNPGEVISNCYSLILGANVTTPHAPTFVMAEFAGTDVLDDWAAHPELNTSAVAEALRWASPVNHVMRYATTDTVVHGTPVAAGEAIVVWLGATNRDPGVFADPETFDIRRRPNKHLAFGIGPHYCVGHSVARLTLSLMFEELLRRYEDFRPAGRPERLISTFASGYKHVPVTARRRPGTGH